MSSQKKYEFSILPLKRASMTLADALKVAKTDLVRDAVIQRFEYTFELSWKTLRRYFDLNGGLREDNLKNIFREAGKQGLIESVENWFGYLEARNLTSQTYSEATAEMPASIPISMSRFRAPSISLAQPKKARRATTE